MPACGWSTRICSPFGPLCDISDPNVVLEASRFCDEWGMDTISAGASVAFAMECAERGLIDEPGLRFGDGEALLDSLQKIGKREGVGELLSKGRGLRHWRLARVRKTSHRM